MLIQQTDRIFDTQFDTAQIIVAKVKTKFVLRPVSGTTGRKAPIYLHITANYQRERLHLHVYTDPKQWNAKLERSNGTDQLSLDLNLVLDNILAKITNIKTIYRLSDKVLTPTILKSELMNATPRIDFVAYFRQKLKDHQTLLSDGSYRRYESVVKKLSEYSTQVLFSDLDEKFLLDYRKYLKTTLQNKDTTVNANIIAIKKYLRAASDDGIKLAVDINKVVGGNTNGSRTSLNPLELRKLTSYYFSFHIPPTQKLVLGYFLFACMTGLRISDILGLERDNIMGSEAEFISVKTKKEQTIALNMMAQKILEGMPELFVKKMSPQKMNEALKGIMKFLQIRKKVSFHVSRHTFATNFLRVGGKVEHLQKLMGHSKIETTMVYVHILAAEANKEIHNLDNLFKDHGFDLDLK